VRIESNLATIGFSARNGIPSENGITAKTNNNFMSKVIIPVILLFGRREIDPYIDVIIASRIT
jgi:hypothetical protein